MSQNILPFSVTFLFFTLLPVLPAIPDPDALTIQTFLPAQSPPTTIPAFPEQSDISRCPLDLSGDIFHGIKSACSVKKGRPIGDYYSGQLHRTRCCPVLAAWLYSAYSKTALNNNIPQQQTTSYEMPLLPDDSETCVDGAEKALENKGIVLVKPNETCDVVYCYCGIRLHPLSCTEAFYVSSEGKLVGKKSVRRLENDCLSSNNNNAANGLVGLAGCSRCLNSLYLLNNKKYSNISKSGARTTKMHNRDCELMGLTWLLAKNRSAYIHTVSAVLRAIMMSTDGYDPQSCSLNSDGMPLAVDSSQINDESSSNIVQLSVYLQILSVSLLYITFFVSSTTF